MIKFFPVAILGVSIFALGGCFTTYGVKEAVGEESEVNIRCFRSDNGNLVVNWTETPIGNESAIYISSPFNKCEHINCYVDAQNNQKMEITQKFQTISPATYLDKQSRIINSKTTQLSQCEVFIALGINSEDDFSGISVIAGQYIVAEKAFPMPEDKPPEPKMWPAIAIGGPVVDVILIGGAPIWWALYEAEKEPIPDGKITVSFDFESGERKETSLTYKEAEEILKKQYPNVYEDFYGLFPQKEITVRFWARAALAQLNLSFREERLGLGSKERNLEFTSIDWEDARWAYDLRDGKPLQYSLMNYIGKTGFLRFSHQPLLSGYERETGVLLIEQFETTK